MSKFKVGDKIVYTGAIPTFKGQTGKIVEGGMGEWRIKFDKRLPNGDVDHQNCRWVLEDYLAANSCASSNPVVQNALKACNADEYVVRKSLSTSKWLLSKKATSLSGGEDKVFVSEQEARDFAKKNGLKVINSKDDDIASKMAYNKCKEALANLERARLYIGGAEDDPDALAEAREIDRAIGQVKAAIRYME